MFLSNKKSPEPKNIGHFGNNSFDQILNRKGKNLKHRYRVEQRWVSNDLETGSVYRLMLFLSH